MNTSKTHLRLVCLVLFASSSCPACFTSPAGNRSAGSDLVSVDAFGNQANWAVDNAFVMGGGLARRRRAPGSGPWTDRAEMVGVSGLNVAGRTTGHRWNGPASGPFSPRSLPVSVETIETGRDGDGQTLLLFVPYENAVPAPAPGAIVLGSLGILLTGWLRHKRVFR